MNAVDSIPANRSAVCCIFFVYVNPGHDGDCRCCLPLGLTHYKIPHIADAGGEVDDAIDEGDA